MTVSERLVAWRTSTGLSQREAARRAGVAQPTWSDLEAGRAKRVSVDTAMAVERVTDGAIRVTEWEKAAADAEKSGSHAAAATSKTGTDEA